ncbi:hypothetical protein FACS1894214_1530 [Planctomycetales bacterium]|nr:hypothetical protein FACS1894214_1530 [Planctomycetales bacterium]
MTTDILSLQRSELVRILNSCGFGDVLSMQQFRYYCGNNDIRGTNGQGVSLLRYAALLTLEWFQPEVKARDYIEQKRIQAERNAEAVRAAQDIGQLPAVENPDRRDAAIESFRTFCEIYFREVFYLPWSSDHLRVIEKIEKAVRSGGLFAMAMPRGSGKTVICQTAVIWAALSGATPFVCLIAASADRAQNLLENIKTWLETNPLLQGDFPEVCYPIKCLERISNRQKGQKYLGVPTRIEWSADKIVLPTIEDSPASGVVISSSGMHGSEIRGQHHARPDGQVVRPQLVLIDDPQTTESAWSWSQSQRRESILAGDVLGMAGPGKKIAGLMACTVIRPDDMASRILDREKHPDWQGERTKMVYSFPLNEKLWARYNELRSDSLRNDGDGKTATDFYRENKEAMDAGSQIAWTERFNPDEISAIQHAMNLKFRDEAAFYAEYQNEPQVETLGDEMMTAEDIASKTNGYERNVIPIDCQYLTMFIDIHQNVLFYLVAAWDKFFSGSVIDYGTFPDQKRQYFSLRDAHYTLPLLYPTGGLEGTIYSGLEELCKQKMGNPYFREDGTLMSVGRCLIDANWGQSTDVIYQFCRQSKFAAQLYPSHGIYVGASSTPFSDKPTHRGDRIGRHWRIPSQSGIRGVRHVLIDTNFWKSFVHARLAVLMGDPGCLSFFGSEAKQHQLLSEHLTAEYRVRTVANNRTVDEWKLRSTRPDNHWLDCMVGSAVAASIEGVELSTLKTEAKPRRSTLKLSDLQRGKNKF